MRQGTIIVLNGTSSSGKTTIAKTLQDIMEGYYIRTGIDHVLEAAPEKMHAMSDGHHPSTTEGFLWVFPHGGTQVAEIRIGPAALRLCAGMYASAAAFATTGNDVIIDDVLFDSRVLAAAVTTLHPFTVLFVGVHCPMGVAEKRERARGDRAQGLVKAHYDRVHAHGIYDLDIDTSILTPLACATQIKERLLKGPAPNAVQRLRNRLGNR